MRSRRRIRDTTIATYLRTYLAMISLNRENQEHGHRITARGQGAQTPRPPRCEVLPDGRPPLSFRGIASFSGQWNPGLSLLDALMKAPPLSSSLTLKEPMALHSGPLL